MDKVTTSRAINRWTGGEPDELFCYRVYIQARLNGSFWIVIEFQINTVFYILRREVKHVERNYYYQRRCFRETKKQAAEICAKAQENETSGDKASKTEKEA